MVAVEDRHRASVGQPAHPDRSGPANLPLDDDRRRERGNPRVLANRAEKVIEPLVFLTLHRPIEPTCESDKSETGRKNPLFPRTRSQPQRHHPASLAERIRP